MSGGDRVNICIELGAGEANVYADVELDPSPYIRGIWLVAEGKPDLEISDYLTKDEKVQASLTMIDALEAEGQRREDEKADFGDWLRDCRKDDRLTGDYP